MLQEKSVIKCIQEQGGVARPCLPPILKVSGRKGLVTQQERGCRLHGGVYVLRPLLLSKEVTRSEALAAPYASI